MGNGVEAQQCEICGHGFSPDERMRFTDQSETKLIEVAYEFLTTVQLQLASVECLLAKLIEVKRANEEVPIA